MRDGTNKRQIASSSSFGVTHIFTAVKGKNGGNYYEKGIGQLYHYSSGYELTDGRDGAVYKAQDHKEIYAALELKYAKEIEFFRYNTDLNLALA